MLINSISSLLAKRPKQHYEDDHKHGNDDDRVENHDDHDSPRRDAGCGNTAWRPNGSVANNTGDRDSSLE